MRRLRSDWRLVAALAALIFSALLAAVVIYLPRYHDHAPPKPTATRTAHPVRITHRHHPHVDSPAPHPALTSAPQPQRTTQRPAPRPTRKPSPHPTHQPSPTPKPTPRPSPSPTCVLGVVCL